MNPLAFLLSLAIVCGAYSTQGLTDPLTGDTLVVSITPAIDTLQTVTPTRRIQSFDTSGTWVFCAYNGADYCPQWRSGTPYFSRCFDSVRNRFLNCGDK